LKLMSIFVGVACVAGLSVAGYGWHRTLTNVPNVNHAAVLDSNSTQIECQPAPNGATARTSASEDAVIFSQKATGSAVSAGDEKGEPSPRGRHGSSGTNTSGTKHRTTDPSWVDWTKPTGGPYPDLSKYHDIWVEVSVSKQRTYIHAGSKKVIYTMIVSTGNDDRPSTATPRGVFVIQPERGLWFYNPKYQEGAEYWVSFLNHGQYLFHSVPMDKHHHVIEAVAKDLGHEDSHGCVHLSIPDAQWFYESIPTGTKVIIHN
jgi:lipoprotein-anchoring transpeptidase ErfK/SrfK